MRPFVFLCTGPLCSGAQKATSLCFAAFVAAVSMWHGPVEAQQIAPEARMHDFGTVARAANTEHRFYVKNNHSSDMHISSIRASCGCTTPIVETEWIKPGETGSILARFNTGTFTGKKAATLTVTIDKPVFTELQLNVKGYIRSDVVLNPGEANFGEVPVGEPKAIDVTLDYAGRNDWSLLGAESPSEFVDVQFEEISRAGGRVSYKISASLSADAPLGILQNQLLLKTNDRNLTTVPIRFIASVQPPVQVSPHALALGTVSTGEPIPQRLVVKARSPFRIIAITSEQAEIRVETSESAKPAHLLNLVIIPNPQASDGVIVGEILLKTDLVDEPIRIPLQFSQLTKNAATSVVKAD
jgi:hypothetical protein